MHLLMIHVSGLSPSAAQIREFLLSGRFVTRRFSFSKGVLTGTSSAYRGKGASDVIPQRAVTLLFTEKAEASAGGVHFIERPTRKWGLNHPGTLPIHCYFPNGQLTEKRLANIVIQALCLAGVCLKLDRVSVEEIDVIRCASPEQRHPVAV